VAVLFGWEGNRRCDVTPRPWSTHSGIFIYWVTGSNEMTT